MTDSERPAPFFLADDRALDFLDSIASPLGSEIEWIADGGDLLDWLEQAGLVPPAALTRLREQAEPEELDAVAAQARQLREWFRGFVAEHAGRPLRPSDLAALNPINTLLAADTAYAQIDTLSAAEPDSEANGRVLGWRHERHWRSPGTLLMALAEAMGELVCRVDFSRVKQCEGPTCTMWFHDVTKNHTRRWCDMAVCGNRAKAAAHRAKKRSAGSRRAR